MTPDMLSKPAFSIETVAALKKALEELQQDHVVNARFRVILSDDGEIENHIFAVEFKPKPITAPNHSEAKRLGFRFRHLRDTNNERALRGTICTQDIGNGRVKAAIVAVNPKDKNATRSEGRNRAYARFTAGRTTEMSVEALKRHLKEGSLALVVNELSSAHINPETLRGAR